MASRPLDVGDVVPSFVLPDQDGAPVELKALLSKVGDKGAVVVFFYPADETPVCTKEACAFRDAYADLAAAGAEVIGISGDSVASHKRFADKHRLSYRLLADTEGHVRDEVFRTPRGLLGLRPGRATYVLDGTGVIRMRHQAALQAQEHVDKAVALVRSLR